MQEERLERDYWFNANCRPQLMFFWVAASLKSKTLVI